MKVQNMTSNNGNKIANQFIIYDDDIWYFQSYKSIIVMKDTLSGFKFLTPEETKKSMESGNLDAFLKGMGTPGGAVDTSFLPL